MLRFYKEKSKAIAFFLHFACAFFALYAFTCLASCMESRGSGQGTIGSSLDRGSTLSTTWLYFDVDGSLVAADKPSAIPQKDFTPWTEALAVMDAGIAKGVPVLLVNKKGVLSAESALQALAKPSVTNALSTLFRLSPSSERAISFPSEKELASGTAAGFAFEDGKAFVRFYRNIVFNNDTSPQPVALFLCGDAPYFPLTRAVTPSDFGAKKDAQFVSLAYTKGSEPWVASFKSRAGASNASGVSFEYFAFSSLPHSESFSSRSLLTNEFQSLSVASSTENLPKAFAKILDSIPISYSVSIQVAGEGFPASSLFSRSGQGDELSAWGFVYSGNAAVLFADGTFYFSPQAENGAVKSLSLPRLNGGYTYTAFVFSEEVILAGWEERRFYETGRSGIIAIKVPEGFFR